MKKIFDENDDDMYKTFRFDNNIMSVLHIPKIELDENNGEELWRYAIFERHYERVRTLYKHIIHQTHWTHISKDYNIDFTRYNYAKESASIKNKKKKLS
jgi:hypothetical protein